MPSTASPQPSTAGVLLQTTDPKAQAKLLAELERQGVAIGRFDPFAPAKPPPKAVPSPPPKPPTLPPLPQITPMPRPTPFPRFEIIQLQLVGVVSGPRLLALVEGTRDGRPFKVRLQAGQTLLDDFVIQQLDLTRMKIQSPDTILTLPVGQMKLLRRRLPTFPT
jgi:hypothetical protein